MKIIKVEKIMEKKCQRIIPSYLSCSVLEGVALMEEVPVSVDVMTYVMTYEDVLMT